MNAKPPTFFSQPGREAPDDAERMEHAVEPGDPQGRAVRGREAQQPQGSDEGQPSRGNPSEVRDSVRYRSRPGIPGLRDPDPSEVLLESFLAGNFDVAYEAAQVLQQAYHEALAEAAKLRFSVNFGTQACIHCRGLEAGPGVVATCYQIRRCQFENVKEGSEPYKLRKVVDLLTK